jgi:uncharacterized protein
MLSASDCRTLTQQFPEIEVIYFFGSRAQGRATTTSDADIGILLRPQPYGLEYKSQLLTALDQMASLSDNVDLTILNTAGTVLKYQVVKHGTVLFERVPGKHKSFLLRTRKEFFDFRPTLEFFYRRKFAH